MNMAAVSPVSESEIDREFLADVLAGLNATSKTLPCKYLYDEAGSQIFEQICELDDYYLTRTEAAIFDCHLSDMAAQVGPQATLIEPGAGNCSKAEPLLHALELPHTYIPIDISPEILLSARGRLEQRLPQLQVSERVGDFTQAKEWGVLPSSVPGRKVIFFPGSTIGNFEPDDARGLLTTFRQQLHAGDGLIIGTDLVKDPVVLERAYNDSDHVTARFNKNLLERINRELAANFQTQLFAHRSFFHPIRQRVEMHLVSLTEQNVIIAGEQVSFAEGETIHTENSHKYTVEGFSQLLEESGFQPVSRWTDPQKHYAIHYAEC